MTLPIRLWLDADAAPRDVKDICIRASDRLKLETTVVANQRLQVTPGDAYVSTVRVDGGADVADGYIVEHARTDDVAVTADVPLAAGSSWRKASSCSTRAVRSIRRN